MTYITNKDPFLEISRGRTPGQRVVRKKGERESFGTTVTGEDIWRGNELTPAPTSHTTVPHPPDVGEQMTVVSESNADNGATATGVLTVRIDYIDAAGAEQTEDVTLNGTTPVNTVATDIRFVNDFYALTVGSNGVAEDHIKIYAQTDSGLVYSMIAKGGNKGLVPLWMVPAGKTLHIHSWSCGEGNNKRLTVRLRATCTPDGDTLLPGVFLFKYVAYVNQTHTGDMTVSCKVPALAIVKASGWASAINGEVSVHWWGVLVDD